MAAFNGEDPRGVWTLTISDDLAGDGGSLDSWGLAITTCTCAVAVPGNPVRVDAHASSGSSNLNGVLEAGETVSSSRRGTTRRSTPFSLFVPQRSEASPGRRARPTRCTDSFAGYGSIAPGASANCFDATGNCYELPDRRGIAADAALGRDVRRAGRRVSGRSTRTRRPPSRPGRSTSARASRTCPTSNQFYPFIENIFHHGVTGRMLGAAELLPGRLQRCASRWRCSS